MKFSSKFVNFFTSKYYSNIKYNHSFSFLLRIFFERAAKVQHTVANLGNVYRNSKWSDLKVQNIKGMHLSSFLTISLLFLTAVTLALILIFKLDNTLLRSSFSVLFWPIVYSIDILSYLWLCVALFLYSISNKLQIDLSSYLYNNLNLKVNFIDHSFNKTAHYSTGLATTLASNNIDSNWVILLHHLYKSKGSIDSLSNLSVTSSLQASENSYNSLNLFLNLNDSNYISELNKKPYTYDISEKCTSKLNKVLNNQVFINHLTLSKLNSANHTLSESYSDSINQNLRLANQTRWALKMTPISEKLVRDNFNYTQAKTLLGSSLVNSLSSSNNIWSSNSLSQIRDNSSFLLSSNITNLNHFEDSRAWSMKKAFFGLDMSTYNLTLSSKNYDSTNTAAAPNDSLLSAYLLDYNLTASHLSLTLSSLTHQGYSYTTGVNISSNDNTIYQDSYNNYIFSLASTSLISNFNNFKHSSTSIKDFQSNLK